MLTRRGNIPAGVTRRGNIPAGVWKAITDSRLSGYPVFGPEVLLHRDYLSQLLILCFVRPGTNPELLLCFKVINLSCFDFKLNA